LSIIGNHEEARKQINEAIELDPLSFVIRYVSMKLNFHNGNFQEALRDLGLCRELYHGKVPIAAELTPHLPQSDPPVEKLY